MSEHDGSITTLVEDTFHPWPKKESIHENRYFQQMLGWNSDLPVDRCITYKNIHIQAVVAVIDNLTNEDDWTNSKSTTSSERIIQLLMTSCLCAHVNVTSYLLMQLELTICHFLCFQVSAAIPILLAKASATSGGEARCFQFPRAPHHLPGLATLPWKGSHHFLPKGWESMERTRGRNTAWRFSQRPGWEWLEMAQ